MSKRLFVGSLAWATTSEELQELFSKFPSLQSARVMTDRETGRSRGFGFVELEDDAEAMAAIEEFNGFELAGRNITVNEARPREERPAGGGFGGGNRGGNNYGGGSDRGSQTF